MGKGRGTLWLPSPRPSGERSPPDGTRYVVAETSFLSFVNLRWSFMCHSSHATSPSMLPLAPAVNPVAVAATVAFVAGATPVLHEPAITAGAPGNGVATPGPTPAASTAYQNE